MRKLLKNLTKKDLLFIIICFTLIVGQVWLELKMPEYMSKITQMVETSGSSLKDILEQGFYMLLCAGGGLVFAIIVGYFATYMTSNFSKNIRKIIFDKVQHFSTKEINKFSTSSLITRTTNDVTQIEMFMTFGLQVMMKAPIMAVWAIMKILDKGFEWSLLTGGCVIILLSFIFTLISIVSPRFEKVQKLIDKINGVTRENLTGIRVVRAFNAEKFQTNRFETVNSDLTNMQLFIQRCFAVMQPVMYIVMHGLTLGIYLIGAFLINAAGMFDKITLFSNMIVFSSYGMQVIFSFLMLAAIFVMWPRANVSAKRINEVLAEESSIKDGKFKGKVKEVGTVEFKNVSFKYPDADDYILNNISFKADKGETVAFIGSTGSGKSTLINLIPRFYDVTDGEILIDGINVKDYKLSDLNNKIGYVPQKAVMFTGTVASNVSYGETDKVDISLDQVKEAVRIAQGKDFVESMEGQYEAHIARDGTNVSGGQKQRLAIARAIARDPEIYIFDDSFSALDYKTDVSLRKELKKHTKDATSLIVAQRIGTIINADKIVVLDNGNCVGIGTHKELLKNCDVYKEIALSQLTKEELDNA